MILAKYGGKVESKLMQVIERRYSRQIYASLIKIVNLNFFEPTLVGYHYRNLMNICMFHFINKVFWKKKKDAI